MKAVKIKIIRNQPGKRIPTKIQVSHVTIRYWKRRCFNRKTYPNIKLNKQFENRESTTQENLNNASKFKGSNHLNE